MDQLGSLETTSDGDALTNRTKPTGEGGSERPRMPSHARLTRQVTDLPPACPAHVYEGGLRKVGMPGMSGD